MYPLEHTETVARLGKAKLVRFLDGHYELHGGALKDRKKAMVWIKQFIPEVAEELREARERKGS